MSTQLLNELGRLSTMAWKEGCLNTAVDRFLDRYGEYFVRHKPFIVEDVSAEMVQASFKRTKESAGALDGWTPMELSMLSLKVYGHIATLLRQVEQGAPWPKSATHARVVFLEKAGAAIGQVMSYRPLTITSPLYRCWATMRLECMGQIGRAHV